MDFETLPDHIKESLSEQLLFIEPSADTSPEPVIDDVTKRLAAALARGEKHGPEWRGVHRCKCGAHSTNVNYKLPNGMITNSLAVHYVAWHRSDVPASELNKIMALEGDELEPTEALLCPPKRATRL